MHETTQRYCTGRIVLILHQNTYIKKCPFLTNLSVLNKKHCLDQYPNIRDCRKIYVYNPSELVNKLV